MVDRYNSLRQQSMLEQDRLLMKNEDLYNKLIIENT